MEKTEKNAVKNAVKNTIVILLILSVGILAAILVHSRLQAQREANLSGEWSARLDMTEQAVVAAFGWLSDIEAVSVSPEDVAACMRNLTIQVNLTLEQTAPGQGTFRCEISPEAYDACRQAAYQALGEAFRAALAERLLMAGYAGSTDEAALGELAEEALGMPLFSYLMSCGPALMPSLEELQARYDGSGSYEAADGILARRFDAAAAPSDAAGTDAVRERYMKRGAELVLYGREISEADGAAAPESGSRSYPMVYTLRDPGKDSGK